MSNPDRTLIMDLSATADARGPQPNDFFICVTRREAVALLAPLASALNPTGWTEGNEEVRNELCRLFWSVANELGPTYQRYLFDALSASGVTIPDGPWEEVR